MSLPQRPIIHPQTLLEAYRQGRFPMCHEDGELYWHDPDPRAVFPLPSIQPNPRMRRAFRAAGFTTTFDTDLSAVINACAGRSETWIDDRIIASFEALHVEGHAHSVEIRVEEELVGGIYGVAIGGAFFGESMFNRAPHAGKAAFFALAAHLQERGYVLFDSQYINDFTESLGAVEIRRKRFRTLLAEAINMDIQF